jgi:hypothetical protein
MSIRVLVIIDFVFFFNSEKLGVSKVAKRVALYIYSKLEYGFYLFLIWH